MAETLGIKRQTARSIISVYLRDREHRHEPLPRRGPHHSKVDEGMRGALQEILDENPLLTLDQINESLRRQLPNKPHISRGTLARTLDGVYDPKAGGGYSGRPQPR